MLFTAADRMTVANPDRPQIQTPMSAKLNDPRIHQPGDRGDAAAAE